MRKSYALIICCLLILSILSLSAFAQSYDDCKKACEASEDYQRCLAAGASQSCYDQYVAPCVQQCPPPCPTTEELSAAAARCKDSGMGYSTYYDDNKCRQVKCVPCPSTEDLDAAIRKCKDAGQDYVYYSDAAQCKQVKCSEKPAAVEPTCPQHCQNDYDACLKAGTDPESCAEKYKSCYNICYPQSTAPPKCEDKCRIAYDDCVKAGNDLTTCKEKYYLPCYRECNPPQEEPKEEEHPCEDKCNALLDECLKSGRASTDCKENVHVPCLNQCHPPEGLACGERCRLLADDCIKAGNDPALCKEKYGLCVHQCSPGEEKECPDEKIVVREVIPENFQLHYKCYEVQELEGPTSYPTVLVRDQFGRERLAVAKPRLLCTPARKELVANTPAAANALAANDLALAHEMGRGVIDHLKCYDVKPLDQEPALPDVSVTDQFGKEKLKLIQPSMLCTPAMKKIEGKEEEEQKDKEERKGCREECLANFNTCRDGFLEAHPECSTDTAAPSADCDTKLGEYQRTCKDKAQACFEECEPPSVPQGPTCEGLRGIRAALCRLFAHEED